MLFQTACKELCACPAWFNVRRSLQRLLQDTILIAIPNHNKNAALTWLAPLYLTLCTSMARLQRTVARALLVSTSAP
jgi:hypothetical protein